MKIFTALECVTDFPDDQIEDGDKIVQLGGRAAACAVSDILKKAGMITSIPELDGEHGWYFGAVQDGREYWLYVLGLSDRVFIETEENVSPFWRMFFGGDGHYERFLSDLYRLLSQDERFRSVNWSDH
jgi:hypothetical protein